MAVEKWGSQVDYYLTLVGYTIGVGSVWKFPYLCARNGGGSFLIPFLIFVVIGSIPMTFLEMFVGQFSQGGPISAWEMCPALKGVGIGSVLISWLFAIYYPVFFAWILYYLYSSFASVLPWSQCGQPWNTPNCVFEHHNDSLVFNASTVIVTNVSLTMNLEVSAGEEFFRRHVLQISDGLESMGSIRWPLVLCLALTFLSVYLCMIGGVKLSGKIVYVTVTCPYILITIFLVKSATLPGAIDGILFYITPQFDKLKDPKVWMEACGLSLYMMGISYGFLMTMAARNPMNNNCLRDSILINLITSFSNIYFGFAIFAITGHVAYQRGVDISAFQSSGFKLGFITYPEAASYLPWPQMWAVFLFVMLFTLGIDSLVPSFEVVTTMLGEYFPRLAKRRWLLNAVVLLPSFFLALPYMTQGGVYFLTLVEWFAFFPAIVLFAILECIVISWIYGVDRIDKTMMLLWNRHLPKVISLHWRFGCPLVLLTVFGYSLYSYRPPQFEEYIFPTWATYLGWLISFSSILPIPCVLIYTVYKAEGNSLKERLSISFKPRKTWESMSTDAPLTMNTVK